MTAPPTSHPTTLPRRLPWGNGELICRLPDAHLEFYARVMPHGRLKCALEDELQLRQGSDRSGPRRDG